MHYNLPLGPWKVPACFSTKAANLLVSMPGQKVREFSSSRRVWSSDNLDTCWSKSLDMGFDLAKRLNNMRVITTFDCSLELSSLIQRHVRDSTPGSHTLSLFTINKQYFHNELLVFASNPILRCTQVKSLMAHVFNKRIIQQLCNIHTYITLTCWNYSV